MSEPEATPVRRRAPATERNRAPILAVLERVLPKTGLVLEIASGSGEHAAFFAPRLPGRTWQPSEPDAEARASIAAWAAETEASTIRPPLDIDVTADDWRLAAADALFCANMIHISPWQACEGLMAGAGRVLPEGGPLVLYGPFKIDGRHTAPSNADFDRMLRNQDAGWGVRDLGEVAMVAGRQGLDLAEQVAMPANNMILVFRRAGLRPDPDADRSS